MPKSSYLFCVVLLSCLLLHGATAERKSSSPESEREQELLQHVQELEKANEQQQEELVNRMREFGQQFVDKAKKLELEKSKELSDCRHEVSQCNRVGEECEKRFALATEHSNTLQKKLEDCESGADRAHGTLSDCRTEVAALKDRLDERNAHIKSTQQNVLHWKNMADTSMSEVSICRNETQRLNEQIRLFMLNSNDCQTASVRLHETLRETNETLSTCKSKHVELVNVIHRAKDDLKGLHLKLVEAQVRLATCEEDRGKDSERFNKTAQLYQKDASNKDSEESAVKQELASVRNDNQRLRDQLAQLQEAWQHDMRLKDQMLADANREIGELRKVVLESDQKQKLADVTTSFNTETSRSLDSVIATERQHARESNEELMYFERWSLAISNVTALLQGLDHAGAEHDTAIKRTLRAVTDSVAFLEQGDFTADPDEYADELGRVGKLVDDLQKRRKQAELKVDHSLEQLTRTAYGVIHQLESRFKLSGVELAQISHAVRSNAKVQAVEAHVRDLDVKNTDLTEQLAQCQASLAKAQLEAQSLGSQLQSETERLQSDNAELMRHRDELNHTVDSLSYQVSQHQYILHRLEGEHNETVIRLQRMHASWYDAQHELTVVKFNNTKMAESLNNVTDLYEHLHTSCNAMQLQLQTELDSRTQECAEFARKAKEHSNAMHARVREIVLQHENSTAQLNMIEGDLADCMARNQRLQLFEKAAEQLKTCQDQLMEKDSSSFTALSDLNARKRMMRKQQTGPVLVGKDNPLKVRVEPIPEVTADGGVSETLHSRK